MADSKQFYLATRDDVFRYNPPFNHGLVTVYPEDNVLEDGTPLEDFGSYILSETPFPDDKKELDRMFDEMVS